jgi:hypothetical protein
MSKTDDIKARIAEWFNAPPAQGDEPCHDLVIHTYTGRPGSNDPYYAERLPELLKQFKCDSYDSLCKAMWKIFCDPKRWKRGEKARGGEEDPLIDVAGFVDPDYSVGNIARYVQRTFYIDTEPFNDNFRLEVTTDEKDQKIVHWTLVVD